MRREMRVFGVLFVFWSIWKGLELGRGVNVFRDVEYLESGYKQKGGS